MATLHPPSLHRLPQEVLDQICEYIGPWVSTLRLVDKFANDACSGAFDREYLQKLFCCVTEPPRARRLNKLVCSPVYQAALAARPHQLELTFDCYEGKTEKHEHQSHGYVCTAMERLSAAEAFNRLSRIQLIHALRNLNPRRCSLRLDLYWNEWHGGKNPIDGTACQVLEAVSEAGYPIDDLRLRDYECAGLDILYRRDDTIFRCLKGLREMTLLLSNLDHGLPPDTRVLPRLVGAAEELQSFEIEAVDVPFHDSMARFADGLILAGSIGNNLRVFKLRLLVLSSLDSISTVLNGCCNSIEVLSIHSIRFCGKRIGLSHLLDVLRYIQTELPSLTEFELGDMKLLRLSGQTPPTFVSETFPPTNPQRYESFRLVHQGDKSALNRVIEQAASELEARGSKVEDWGWF